MLSSRQAYDGAGGELAGRKADARLAATLSLEDHNELGEGHDDDASKQNQFQQNPTRQPEEAPATKSSPPQTGGHLRRASLLNSNGATPSTQQPVEANCAPLQYQRRESLRASPTDGATQDADHNTPNHSRRPLIWPPPRDGDKREDRPRISDAHHHQHHLRPLDGDEDDQDQDNDSEGEPDDERRRFIGRPERNHYATSTSSANAQPTPAPPPICGHSPSGPQDGKRRAQLAKQESITEQAAARTGALSYKNRSKSNEDQEGDNPSKKKTPQHQQQQHRKHNEPNDDADAAAACPCRLASMLSRFLRAKPCLAIPLLILVIYIAVIYCVPFIEINPSVPSELPAIPFDFRQGPLAPSSASAFKHNHLFKGQIHGPESLAFDSHGNCYMAVEGGFILYAYLNRTSSPTSLYNNVNSRASRSFVDPNPHGSAPSWKPTLVKVAELNGPRLQHVASQTIGPKRGAHHHRGGGQDDHASSSSSSSTTWRRECQLDEKVYGPQLFVQNQEEGFRSNVRVSRCSKPLGIRLSADESQLYVIDTLSGLYRVSLRDGQSVRGPQPQLQRPPFQQQQHHAAPHVWQQPQRPVTKLLDFRANNGVLVLPAIQLEDEPEMLPGEAGAPLAFAQPATRLMNVSMKALDDLVIDRTPDGRADLIYMTVASQTWPATSFIFDVLEGNPSGRLLRYNTATNQLVVLEPARVAHVRTSALLRSEADGSASRTVMDNDANDELAKLKLNRSLLQLEERTGYHQPSFLLGAPRLDENDIFDNRPLNFPNGLELTDDRHALLIADTSNKRIVRHWLRGPRRGSSDLWAWTPMFPDNIRRGFDRQQETYWVVGCGRAPVAAAQPANGWAIPIIPSAAAIEDPLALLRTWPRLRKFLLKNIYFFGYLVESIGENLIRSRRVQDVGYELRTGSSLCASGCTGMMILQYNRHGDVIRSIHSREFPNDLYYYSQVNELIDPENQEHALYLGSPSYSYLTKLTLPTESRAQQQQQPPVAELTPQDILEGFNEATNEV